MFDFADPNVCMGRRNVSTVATQALYLMNSPFVVDNAKAAAKKLLALPGLGLLPPLRPRAARQLQPRLLEVI